MADSNLSMLVSLYCSVDKAKEAIKTKGNDVQHMDYTTALASLSKSNPVGALAKFAKGTKFHH